jgi:hypothetical protein
MNKKYDNNNIIIASRAYFLQVSSTIIPCSPLSRSSLDNDRTLLDMDIATDGSCDLFGLINHAMDMHQHGALMSPFTSSPMSTQDDDLSLTNAFMNLDSDALNKLDSTTGKRLIPMMSLVTKNKDSH